MKIDDFFLFKKDIGKMKDASTFYCIIKSNVTTKEELFSCLKEQLKFKVFGWNWDALDDALCDLGQIKQKKIVVVHEKIEIDIEILSIYLSSLTTAALIWKKYSSIHVFIPIFHDDDKDKIIKILHSKDIIDEFNILKKQINLQ